MESLFRFSLLAFAFSMVASVRVRTQKGAVNLEYVGARTNLTTAVYYQLDNMVEVDPTPVAESIDSVALRWQDGKILYKNEKGYVLQPCTFVSQTQNTCNLDETTQRAYKFEGIRETGPGPLPRNADITAFHQMSSYCRFQGSATPTFSLPAPSYIRPSSSADPGRAHWLPSDLSDLYQHLKSCCGEYLQTRAVEDYRPIDIAAFVQAVAVMSEIQLRYPEVMASMDEAKIRRFIPEYDGTRLTKEISNIRRLKDNAGTPIQYDKDYKCDAHGREAIAKSRILTEMGCRELQYYRPPNYFRALVIVCLTASGEKVPLAESKGCGLPRWAAHTKNMQPVPYAMESMRGVFGMKPGEHKVQFAFERAIERWRLSDHGSGKLDLDEGRWEYALSKYVGLILQTDRFRDTRKQSCRFMLKYLKIIFGEDQFKLLMQDRIYMNSMPQNLHDVGGCTSMLSVVSHLAVLDIKWRSHKGDSTDQGMIAQGLLIRGMSKRSMDSIYTNPDLCGHPGVNHFVAGIHTALLGSGGLMMQDAIDISKNKQMGGSRMGRLGMWYARNFHVTSGKVFYMNIQADEAREKLFDYGHAGLYRSRADPRVGVVRGITRKSEKMTDGLLEFLKSHNPASTFYPSMTEEAVAKRLFDGWKFVVLDDSGLTRDQARFWMFNQVLYWDPALAYVLSSYRMRIDSGGDPLLQSSAALRPEGEQLHSHMASAFGYRSEVSHCVLIAHLFEPLVKRYHDFNVVVYPIMGQDKRLNSQPWPKLFLQALWGKTSLIQDVCRCLWSYDQRTQRHTFPDNLHSLDKRTSLHWLTPNLCLAAGAGIRQVNNAPISHMGAHDGDAYMYDQLGAQIRELIAWAQKTQK